MAGDRVLDYTKLKRPEFGYPSHPRPWLGGLSVLRGNGVPVLLAGHIGFVRGVHVEFAINVVEYLVQQWVYVVPIERPYARR